MEIMGKVALVTGAGSGIGRATAVALAHAGAAVMVADVDEAGGMRTVEEIRQGGGQAAFVNVDISTPAGIRQMFAATEAAFGGVDIVHNNAGIVVGSPGWLEAPLERIAHVVAVNTSGVIMGTQSAVHAMRKRGGGVVVNTASLAAHGTGRESGMPEYAATKAAVAMFTSGCARLMETDRVRVNAVSPGFVRTEFQKKTGDGVTPADWILPAMERVGDAILPPEKIAEAVLDLIRDDSTISEIRIVPNEVPGGPSR